MARQRQSCCFKSIGSIYLNISQYVVAEGVRRNRQISVHRPPMPKKCLVADRIELVEKHRHLNGLLEIWLGFIVKLRVGEAVVNLCPRHS